jgi:hypothetical protein
MLNVVFHDPFAQPESSAQPESREEYARTASPLRPVTSPASREPGMRPSEEEAARLRQQARRRVVADIRLLASRTSQLASTRSPGPRPDVT